MIGCCSHDQKCYSLFSPLGCSLSHLFFLYILRPILPIVSSIPFPSQHHSSLVSASLRLLSTPRTSASSYFLFSAIFLLKKWPFRTFNSSTNTIKVSFIRCGQACRECIHVLFFDFQDSCLTTTTQFAARAVSTLPQRMGDTVDSVKPLLIT